ncbi:unnamed protein product [Aphanomyces euteiches]|uniref:Arf-GAP domain-containing protein n=1 Tax=Aphanomyces euteiches TaxID=100861 RepID=A0A6G0WWD7_9STRA|nr:hypothetical protein Ae201684_011091 [Aphanomyces euteiches]KAH9058628.1 hypothetical protein Ae201684P_005970 [Aphanomyces euteiches]KAH9136149.1 hypothetical protein AeRB84_018617 [Aphanomyces euteiches]
MATYVSHEVRNKFFQAQRSIAANKLCFDCDRRSPMWATVSFGTYMCLDCSGYHRRMGVHVSFVRSTDMDEWTEEQLLLMQLGGNGEARNFFKQHGVTDMMNIDEKYKTKAATLYKAQLAKKVQAGKFDSTPYSTAEVKTKSADEFGGLDGLAKIAETVSEAPSAYIARAVAVPAPARPSTETPPAAPASGLLSARPTVLLGGESSAPATTGSTITSKLSSRKTTSSASAKKSTRLGATKVKTNFDDFDNIPFENAKPSPQEIQQSKQIDEDEALARAMQQAEEESLSRSFQQTTIQPKAEPLAADSLNKYKNSKSISSDNFFAAEQTQVDHDKIRQFSNAQAISSDMYYGDGRARSPSTEAAEQAAYQLDLLKSQVADKAQQLKNMTSSFFSDLQSRYS